MKYIKRILTIIFSALCLFVFPTLTLAAYNTNGYNLLLYRSTASSTIDTLQVSAFSYPQSNFNIDAGVCNGANGQCAPLATSTPYYNLAYLFNTDNGNEIWAFNVGTSGGGGTLSLPSVATQQGYYAVLLFNTSEVGYSSCTSLSFNACKAANIHGDYWGSSLHLTSPDWAFGASPSWFPTGSWGYPYQCTDYVSAVAFSPCTGGGKAFPGSEIVTAGNTMVAGKNQFMLANVYSAFGSSTPASWMYQFGLAPIIGGGLGVLVQLLPFIIGLAIIGTIVYFAYRAFKFGWPKR